ncbi:toxin [Peribacillus sp. FSL H8-0477]|uniref:anthrax toxin lethal factor-related metalloendopeptidase n=1 Tax=Peribacillus sp. FSL H8-0477 TaxID=2921388 RepID=UPI0030F8EDC8
MKRRLIVFLLTVFIILFSIFSIYSFTSASGNGVSWSDLPGKHALKTSPILQRNTGLQKLFLFPKGNFNTAGALSIVERVSYLPEDLINKLNQDRIKIQLFTGDLTDNSGARYLKGTTPRGYLNQETTWDDVPGMGGSRIVYVKIGASGKGQGHGSVNLELHELAHTIDKMVYGEIHDKEAFLSAWKKEVTSLFPGQSYFHSYPEEYFAETFAMYYLNPEEKELLKRKAPLTYIFIGKL